MRNELADFTSCTPITSIYPPLVDYMELLKQATVDPEAAAKVVARHMGLNWEPFHYVKGAPELLHFMADEHNWERFGKEEHRWIRLQTAAYYLLRAAAHLNPRERDSRDMLISRGMSRIAELVNEWLKR